MKVTADVGRRLHQVRQSKGMTRGSLARKSGVGIPTISKLEQGFVGTVRDGSIVRLETALGESLRHYETIVVDEEKETVPGTTVPEQEQMIVQEDKPATMGMEDMLNLMSGKTLTDMVSTTAKFDGVKAAMQQIYTNLTSADLSVVKTALTEMLSAGKQEELPVLSHLVDSTKIQHRNTPLLMAALRNRIPVWLHGEAGSGKTTAAECAAESLGLDFAFISVCPTSTKSDFLGYMNAVGSYVSTAFRSIYSNGGVYLIDEIDNGNPSILAVLNSALANGHCAFPDEIVKRHEDCVIVAAANTIGRGATAEYVGRNAIDAATLDRFAFVEWNIDEALESAVIGGTWEYKPVRLASGDTVGNEEWLGEVRAARKACGDLGIKHIISPRATFYGVKLAALGVGKRNLLNMLIYKGMRDTDKQKLSNHLAK